MTVEKAVCRHCRLKLIGKPYRYGGSALHPVTKETIKINYYGGFICSRFCDHEASLELERSMPGHGYEQKSLGTEASKSLINNWN